MLAWPQLAIRPPAWRNCPFFFCRGDQFETRLSHRFSPPIESTVCNLAEEWTDASSKTETQLACVTFSASWVSNLEWVSLGGDPRLYTEPVVGGETKARTGRCRT